MPILGICRPDEPVAWLRLSMDHLSSRAPAHGTYEEGVVLDDGEHTAVENSTGEPLLPFNLIVEAYTAVGSLP